MTEVVYHRLRVADVVTETPDACSLVFELTPAQRDRFGYRPGQFLTLRIPHERGAIARCYSLASSPHVDQRLTVTVKRIAGGDASNWLCDNARAGVELDVLEPAGRFTPASLDGDFLFFAAGSGITPIISIATSVLAGGTGTSTLYYANRDERSVIFRDRLNRLHAEYPGRLHVVHWLESVQGLPTVAALRALAERAAGAECFSCGPKPFLTVVRTALREIGFPAGHTHLERFASLGGDPFAAARPVERRIPATGRTMTVEVEINGERRTLDWPADKRLLDLLTEHGLDAPASCGEGVCAACECRVVEGEVRMVDNQVLEEEDLAEGYVLACQALPVSDLVRISYG